MESNWREAIEQRRTEKDQYLGEHEHSPIPPSERESFDGLEYYPIDEDFRFEVPLEEHDEKDEIIVETSSDGERVYLNWGQFSVEIDDREVLIQAYRTDPDDERLWIPFRDETSGQETYGAGRYIDLRPDRHRREDGTWILDFNEAYNPTCAYNPVHECPLPPVENWLNVRIEAGEKDYPGESVVYVPRRHQ